MCRVSDSTVGSPKLRRARVLVTALVVVATLSTGAVAQAVETFRFHGSGYGHGIGMSQWGAYGLAQKGWPHRRILTALLLAHARRGLLDAAEEGARGTHGRPSEDPSAPAAGRSSCGSTDPARRSSRRSRPGRRGPSRPRRPSASTRSRRHARLGRRGPVGRSCPTAVRHLRPGGRPGVRPRSRRGLASGIRVRVRVPRVRSDRMRRSLRGATHDRAPVRGVPPRDGGDAEQLADRRAADPGRRRPDVRDLQDRRYGLRSDCDCHLLDGSGDQVYVGWNKESGPDGDRWVAAVVDTRRKSSRIGDR